MSDALVASPLAHALGLSLLQFAWQGALLGSAGALALLTLRRASAHLRYLTMCLTMAAMVGTVAVTFTNYLREFSGLPAVQVAGARVTLFAALPVPAEPPTMIADTPPAAGTWVETQWPLVVTLWAAGVLFCAIRFLRAWMMVARVRRFARPAASPTVERAAELRSILGITRRLRILESALVDVPSVIGWLRPLILVPASALAGLPPSHLDAVLAHELAHVRRHDYLVNLLQSVVEILLFYHPAVWWVSRQIRREREHCCDDVAVSICGDRVAYAAALASLETLRLGSPALAMGAQGGDLLTRVRRLVSPQPIAERRASSWIPLVAALGTIAIVIGAQGRSAAQDKTVQAFNVQAAPVSPAAPMPTALDKPAPRSPAVAHAQSAANASAPAPPRDPRPAVEQAAAGSIAGKIIDPQGGSLPGATVTATADIGSAHVVRSAVTTPAGLYQLAGLEPGLYVVTMTLPGFRTSSTQVRVGPSETQLSARLEVGTLTETITVVRGTTSAVPGPADPRGPNDFLDLARQYYEVGRLAEATAMTSRALELMRGQTTVAVPVEINSNPNAPVRVGGDIRPPRKVRDVKPIYPAGTDTANLRGIVILEAVIGRDGTVKDAQILRSIPGLNDAALEAVRQWQYTPTLLNGVPVEVVITVTVNFAGAP